MGWSGPRLALLGRSVLVALLVNFALRVHEVLVPTRFFTDEALAIAWLTEPAEGP